MPCLYIGVAIWAASLPEIIQPLSKSTAPLDIEGLRETINASSQEIGRPSVCKEGRVSHAKARIGTMHFKLTGIPFFPINEEGGNQSIDRREALLREDPKCASKSLRLPFSF